MERVPSSRERPFPVWLVCLLFQVGRRTQLGLHCSRRLWYSPARSACRQGMTPRRPRRGACAGRVRLTRSGRRPRAKEVGMASRWRIRQKLMFGLGLVVVIMALLLAGTLRGLYSYYLATNSIRSKLAELNVAEEFRNEIYTLVAKRKELTEENAPPYGKSTEAARQKLLEYEAQLQETLAHGRDPTNGIMELEWIGFLHERLDPGKKLQKAIIQSANLRGRKSDIGGTGRTDEREGEESEGKDAATDPASREFQELVRDVDQLRNTIRDEL